MHGLNRHLNLSAAALLPWLLLACGDSGSPTPTGPLAPQNRAPAVLAQVADRRVEEDAELRVEVSGALSDPDGDALVYGAASDAPSVARVSVSGNEVTVRGVAPGTATITVTVTDPGGLGASQAFTVTVTAANRGPFRPRSRTRAWKRTPSFSWTSPAPSRTPTGTA